jgi:cyanoexosortase A
VTTSLLQNSKFWLLGIAGGLIALHLHVAWVMTHSIDQLTMSLLFWVAALRILWKERYTLSLESEVTATCLGLFLIAWVLIKNTSIHSQTDILVQITPFFSALGLGLVASGFKGLKQYRRSLAIIFLLSLPIETLSELINKIIGSTILVAKFSTFVLWYLGFQVQRQGVQVILPTGTVEVYPRCSGVNLMLIIVQLGVLATLIFHLKYYQKILLPIIGALLAFIINGIRVTLMAVLVANSNQTAFEYWHGEEGAQIFTTICILIFGLFCYLLVQLSEKQREKEFSSQDSMEF